MPELSVQEAGALGVEGAQGPDRSVTVPVHEDDEETGDLGVEGGEGPDRYVAVPVREDDEESIVALQSDAAVVCNQKLRWLLRPRLPVAVLLVLSSMYGTEVVYREDGLRAFGYVGAALSLVFGSLFLGVGYFRSKVGTTPRLHTPEFVVLHTGIAFGFSLSSAFCTLSALMRYTDFVAEFDTPLGRAVAGDLSYIGAIALLLLLMVTVSVVQRFVDTCLEAQLPSWAFCKFVKFIGTFLAGWSIYSVFFDALGHQSYGDVISYYPAWLTAPYWLYAVFHAETFFPNTTVFCKPSELCGANATLNGRLIHAWYGDADDWSRKGGQDVTVEVQRWLGHNDSFVFDSTFFAHSSSEKLKAQRLLADNETVASNATSLSHSSPEKLQGLFVEVQLGLKLPFNYTMPTDVFEGFGLSESVKMAACAIWRPVVWGLMSQLHALMFIVGYVRALRLAGQAGELKNPMKLFCIFLLGIHQELPRGWFFTFPLAQQMWLYIIAVLKRVSGVGQQPLQQPDRMAAFVILWYAVDLVHFWSSKYSPQALARQDYALLPRIKDAVPGFEIDDLVNKADQKGGFRADMKRYLSHQLSHLGLAENLIAPTPRQDVEDIRTKLIADCRVNALAKAANQLSAVFRENPNVEFEVRREHLLDDSFKEISKKHAYQLLSSGNFTVKFISEQGIDWGGLRRDWFSSVATRLFQCAEKQDSDSLFMLAEDGTLVPRPCGPAKAAEFVSCGRYIAFSIAQRQPIRLPLGGILTKHMCGEEITYNDVRKLDPTFFKNRVELILRPGGIEEYTSIMGEPPTFMSAPTEKYPEAKPLNEGGESILVTEQNGNEYCQLLCEFYLCDGIRQEMRYLLTGFWDVIPKTYLKDIKHSQLSLMINGVETLDVDSWKKHALIAVSPEDREYVDLFWQVLREFSDQEKALLLQFSTGSSCLPPSGFAGLKPQFKLNLNADPPTFLPHSHTCFNQLLIPRYPDKATMAEKIRSAIVQTEGFGFA